MKKSFLFTLALLGLPLTTGIFSCIWNSLFLNIPIGDVFGLNSISFFVGFFLMMTIYHFYGEKLSITYVFAHEMTHAIAGILCGAKIHKISVRNTGGMVTLSKSNMWITLAPYVVPCYTFLVIILKLAINFFLPNFVPSWLWLALIGFTIAFHVLYTFNALTSVSQPDTHVYGVFFSYWMIVTLNLLQVVIVIVLFHPTQIIADLYELCIYAKRHYVAVFDGLRFVFHLTKDLFYGN